MQILQYLIDNCLCHSDDIGHVLISGYNINNFSIPTGTVTSCQLYNMVSLFQKAGD